MTHQTHYLILTIWRSLVIFEFSSKDILMIIRLQCPILDGQCPSIRLIKDIWWFVSLLLLLLQNKMNWIDHSNVNICASNITHPIAIFVALFLYLKNFYNFSLSLSQSLLSTQFNQCKFNSKSSNLCLSSIYLFSLSMFIIKQLYEWKKQFFGW